MGCAAPDATLDGREKAAVAVSALIVTLAAWWVLVTSQKTGGGHVAHAALKSVAETGPSPTLPAMIAMWTAMATAMMLPPVTPWIWFHAKLSKNQETGKVAWGATALFALAYLVLWTLFGALSTGAEIFLKSAGLLNTGGSLASRVIAGAVIIAAGAYQLTPMKNACLTHCRSPLSYFIGEWRDGPAGSFRMGFSHGLYCMGCCWALMAVGFAVGVMNLAWMALLTLFLCVEKIAPGGDRIGKVFGVALIVYGAFHIYVGLR